ncbi:MAG: carboxypeptidase regulatory-like domain-containing protein [Planctomycetes bacterium]|nr:carboxypeptidase regulatory-like domain-containing protein [Planctomycetota bacterium]
MSKLGSRSVPFLALLVLSLLAGGAWLTLRGEDSRPSDTRQLDRASALEVTRTAEPLQAPPSSTDVARRDAASVEGRAAVPSAAVWIARGRAQSADGRALEGALVELSLHAGDPERSAALERLELASDAEGAFAWELEALPRGATTLRFHARKDGWFAYVGEREVSASESLAPLVVKLYPLDVIVRGVVRSESGEPLAGAELRAQGDRVEANRDGRYELRTSSALRELWIDASAPRHASAREIVKPSSPGASIELDFTLATAFQIRGRVRDEAGQPVAGARVTTFFTMSHAVESDAEGGFELDRLDPKRESHALFARKDGYVEGRAEVKPRGTAVVAQDLVLKRGTRVEGVVVDEQGRPVEGAALYIGFSPSAYNRLDARSDGHGNFLFPAVDVGSQTIVAQHARFAPLRQVFELGAGPAIHPLKLVLQRAHFAGGVVRDEAGQPVAELRVAGQVAGEYIEARTSTDAAGRFRIEGLPTEGLSLEFYGSGIVRNVVPLLALDREDLEFVVQRAGKVAGRVVDAQTGQGLDDFAIRFVSPTLEQEERAAFGYSATWAREGKRFTRTDGYWDSGDETLPPGGYLGIEARAPGRALARAARVAVEAAPARDAVVLRLGVGGAIRGRVLAADGTPAAGVKLTWRAAGAEPGLYYHDEPHEYGVVFSDADGRFALSDVPPGASLLCVAAAKRPPFDDGPFEVAAGATVEREIRMAEALALRGRVQDAAGRAVASALVRVTALASAGTRFAEEGRSDAQGEFLFNELGAGRYDVAWIDKRERVEAARVTRRIELSPNTPAEVLLKPEGTAVLHGSLRCAADLPALVSVNVLYAGSELQGREAPRRFGALAEKGQFTIEGLLPGAYVLNAYFQRGNELWQGAKRIELGPGETSGIELEMQR